MADESLLSKVHGLSDLELAALLCLMNREHCPREHAARLTR